MLSYRGAMLSPVCDLNQEIANFLYQENLPHFHHFDPQWFARLALLMNITEHLNALIVKLQAKDSLVTDMHAHINVLNCRMLRSAKLLLTVVDWNAHGAFVSVFPAM